MPLRHNPSGISCILYSLKIFDCKSPGDHWNCLGKHNSAAGDWRNRRELSGKAGLTIILDYAPSIFIPCVPFPCCACQEKLPAPPLAEILLPANTAPPLPAQHRAVSSSLQLP
ncbi:unnamed protein product [Natator depressus]